MDKSEGKLDMEKRMKLRQSSDLLCLFFFFFQAEDGIRDTSVTGVQTCALPICDGFQEIDHQAQLKILVRNRPPITIPWDSNRVTAWRSSTQISVGALKKGDKFWEEAEGICLDFEDYTPDRKSVVQGKSVDLGGRRIIKKKK